MTTPRPTIRVSATVAGNELAVGDIVHSIYGPGDDAFVSPYCRYARVEAIEPKTNEYGAAFVVLHLSDGSTHEAWEHFRYDRFEVIAPERESVLRSYAVADKGSPSYGAWISVQESASDRFAEARSCGLHYCGGWNRIARDYAARMLREWRAEGLTIERSRCHGEHGSYKPATKIAGTGWRHRHWLPIALKHAERRTMMATPEMKAKAVEDVYREARAYGIEVPA